MIRVGRERNFTQQIDYHLADGRAPWFIETQTGRIELARFLIDKIIREHEGYPRLKVVELGCGAGDISGPLNKDHNVIGFDVTAAAEEACRERWPRMAFRRQPVEDVAPFESDILVMTEFLEHVIDPVSIVKSWLPLARWAVIGHPLHEPDPPIEPGHIWSYTRTDWRHWFELGDHQWWEEFRFPLGVYDEMILGHSKHR